MVRLVLFDVDGTLVHTGRAGIKAFAKVFATEFGIVDGVERLNFAGRTDVSLVREFLGFHNIQPTPATLELFFDRYVFWLDHILSQSKTEMCPGVRESIRDLKALPQPPLRGLLTGNIRLGAEIKLRHFRLWDEFETGAFADDNEDRNQIAAIAMQRGSRILGRKLRGDEVLVVGDTPLDITCARSIGAKVLAVATASYSLEELSSHKPDLIARDLTEISVLEACR